MNNIKSLVKKIDTLLAHIERKQQVRSCPVIIKTYWGYEPVELDLNAIHIVTHWETKRNEDRAS